MTLHPRAAAFAYENFVASRRTRSLNRFAENHRRSSATSAFTLGRFLEEDTVMLQATRAGVFPGETQDVISADQSVLSSLQALYDSDYRERLPTFWSLEGIPTDLKSAIRLEEAARYATETETETLRYLHFRGGSDRHLNPSFAADLIFGTQQNWSDVLRQLSSELVQLERGDVAELASLAGLYEFVVTCADKMSSLQGLPWGEFNPWAGSDQESTLSFHTQTLEKFSPDAANVVRVAYRLLVDEHFWDDYFTATLDDYLHLRVLHVMRLPEGNSDYSEARRLIVGALTAEQASLAAIALGPRWIWASDLWRVAPGDKRSVARLQEAVDLCSQAFADLTAVSRTDYTS